MSPNLSTFSDGEYSNQGSEGGRHGHQPSNLNLDPNLDGGYNAQGYSGDNNDPHSLRLGQVCDNFKIRVLLSWTPK